MLLIVAASLASSFSTAGAPSETAGKATTTMVTNANVNKALTCQWSNYALESEMMLKRRLGYLLCNKGVACA